MTVTELTKEIYDEFPKVWDKLDKEYNNKCAYKYFETLKYDFSCEQVRYIVSIDGYLKVVPFSFSRLYGLLDDFFEENGIEIYAIPDYSYDKKEYKPTVVFWNPGLKVIYEVSTATREEARYEAVLKACEILNNKLLKGEITWKRKKWKN